MATTYDYQTGRITRDFHFIRWYEPCKGSGLPCYAGSLRCQKCQHYKGSINPFSIHIQYGMRLQDSYVYCGHPDKQDSENSFEAAYAFNKSFQHEALCALDY